MKTRTMNTPLHQRRKQIDHDLLLLKKYLPSFPKSGWIAEIRTKLQMTTAQLARRVGVAQSVVTNFEKSERSKSITLNSLSRLAEALECELHYVLIPKKSLQKSLSDRAKIVLEREEKTIAQHMNLEGQGTKDTFDKAYERALLITNKDKRLWEDDE